MKVLRKIFNSTYFRILVTLLLVVLFSRLVNYSEVVRLLPTLDPVYLVVIFALITLDRVVMAFKWGLLLKAQDIHIPLFDLVRTYYIGNFIGAFLPATVGTDIARAVHLNKHRPDLSKIASSIIIERMLGFFALAVFSLVASFFVIGYMGNYSSKFLWFNLLILAALALALAVSFSVRIRLFLEERFAFFKENDIYKKLKKSYTSYQAYRDQQKVLVVFTILSAFELLFPIVTDYFVALSLGLHVPFLFFVVAIPIFLFLARIPVAPNILGIQEGLFVLLFSFANVPATQAFTMGLAQHILTLLGLTPGLFFYLFDTNKKAAPVEPAKYEEVK